MPAPGPAAGSQIPEMSRLGAGVGFSSLKSKSYTAPGWRAWPNVTSGMMSSASTPPTPTLQINTLKRFCIVTLPSSRLRLVFGRFQDVPIREHHLHDASDRLATLYGPYGHCNLISGLEALDAPPAVDHVRRITGFHHPAHSLPVCTLDVELKEGVRVGPYPFNNSPFQDKAFCRVVLKSRRAMVCDHRTRHD